MIPVGEGTSGAPPRAVMAGRLKTGCDAVFLVLEGVVQLVL